MKQKKGAKLRKKGRQKVLKGILQQAVKKGFPNEHISSREEDHTTKERGKSRSRRNRGKLEKKKGNILDAIHSPRGSRSGKRVEGIRLGGRGAQER